MYIQYFLYFVNQNINACKHTNNAKKIKHGGNQTITLFNTWKSYVFYDNKYFKYKWSQYSMLFDYRRND